MDAAGGGGDRQVDEVVVRDGHHGAAADDAGLLEHVDSASVGAHDRHAPRPHLVVELVRIVGQVDHHDVLAEVEEPAHDAEADAAEAAHEHVIGVGRRHCGLPSVAVEDRHGQAHHQLPDEQQPGQRDEHEHGAAGAVVGERGHAG